jgi:hypothetical protein
MWYSTPAQATTERQQGTLSVVREYEMTSKLRCPFKKCWRLRFESNTCYLSSHLYIEHTMVELANLLSEMVEK